MVIYGCCHAICIGQELALAPAHSQWLVDNLWLEWLVECLWLEWFGYLFVVEMVWLNACGWNGLVKCLWLEWVFFCGWNGLIECLWWEWFG